MKISVKRYRDSRMMQRWLAAVLLFSEKGFRRIKGFDSIPDVLEQIEAETENEISVVKAA
jgi:hypothetical protein